MTSKRNFFLYFSKMKTFQQLTDTLRERLSLFSFFHLGSDAKIGIAETSEGLKISVAHSRVHPFEIAFTWPEVQKLLAEPSRFETLLLDYLTRYRRS